MNIKTITEKTLSISDLPEEEDVLPGPTSIPETYLHKKEISLEPSKQAEYEKLNKLKLPTVLHLSPEIDREVLLKLAKNNIATFELSKDKYIFCEFDTFQYNSLIGEKGLGRFLIVDKIERDANDTPVTNLTQAEASDLQNIEIQADETRTTLDPIKARSRVSKAIAIAASATQMIPGLKYIKKKMNKLEDSGFYKYNDNVVIPGQNSGQWGISTIEGYIDGETALPISIDLTEAEYNKNPRVFLLRQIILMKANMPHSNAGIKYIENMMDLTKKDLFNAIKNAGKKNKDGSSNSKDLVDVINRLMTFEITDLQISEIDNLKSRFDKNVSVDRLSIKKAGEAAAGGAITGIYGLVTAGAAAGVSAGLVAPAILGNSGRSVVEAGFDVKREVSKIDPKVLGQLSFLTAVALIFKGVTNNIDNPLLRTAGGFVVGIASSALITKKATEMAEEAIVTKGAHGETISEREKAEIREEFKKNGQAMVRFHSSLSGILSILNHPTLKGIFQAENITREELDQHLTGATPNQKAQAVLEKIHEKTRGFHGGTNTIEEELNKNGQKDLSPRLFTDLEKNEHSPRDPLVEDGANHENVANGNHVNRAEKPPIDGSPTAENHPNGAEKPPFRVNNNADEDVKDTSVGRVMERRAPGHGPVDLPYTGTPGGVVTLGTLRPGLIGSGGDSPQRYLTEVATPTELDNATRLAIAYYRNMSPAVAEAARVRLLGLYAGNTQYVNAIFGTDRRTIDEALAFAGFGKPNRANLAGIASALYHENLPAGGGGFWETRMERAPGTLFELPDFIHPAPLAIPGLPGVTDPFPWLLAGGSAIVGLLLFGAVLKRTNNQPGGQAANIAGAGINPFVHLAPNAIAQPQLQRIILPYRPTALARRWNRHNQGQLRNLVNALRGFPHMIPNNALLALADQLSNELDQRNPNAPVINGILDGILEAYLLAYPNAGVAVAAAAGGVPAGNPPVQPRQPLPPVQPGQPPQPVAPVVNIDDTQPVGQPQQHVPPVQPPAQFKDIAEILEVVIAAHEVTVGAVLKSMNEQIKLLEKMQQLAVDERLDKAKLDRSERIKSQELAPVQREKMLTDFLDLIETNQENHKADMEKILEDAKLERDRLTELIEKQQETITKLYEDRIKILQKDLDILTLTKDNGLTKGTSKTTPGGRVYERRLPTRLIEKRLLTAAAIKVLANPDTYEESPNKKGFTFTVMAVEELSLLIPKLLDKNILTNENVKYISYVIKSANSRKDAAAKVKDFIDRLIYMQ